MPCPQQLGLVGYLFDSSLDGPDIHNLDFCEMAYEIRKKIWCKLRELQFEPTTPIEIDGEVWAPDRLIKALTDLYDWTLKACANESTAVAIIGSHNRCGHGGCNPCS